MSLRPRAVRVDTYTRGLHRAHPLNALAWKSSAPFAIGLATDISEKEIALLMVGRIEPTEEQRERLEGLLKNYKLAIKLVNAETMKGRL